MATPSFKLSSEFLSLSKAKKEAYMNEFKGGLFEFLVGKQLAIKQETYAAFYQSRSSEELERLQVYQEFLGQYSTHLPARLQEFAEEVERVIRPFLEAKLGRAFSVDLIGRKSDHQEGDLVGFNSQLQLPFSLKLTKDHSYVNTKSAGLKSLLADYFAPFASAGQDQKVLKQLSKDSFESLLADLGRLAKIERDLTVLKDFKEEWLRQGHSELPGELDPAMRARLFDYYHEMITFIFQCFTRYHQENPGEFFSCLLPLLGLSQKNLFQVFVFYEKVGTENEPDFKFKEVKTVWGRENLEQQFLGLHPPAERTSSFEIHFKDFIHQIRVKPMNKFTAPALKINSSLKFSRDDGSST